MAQTVDERRAQQRVHKREWYQENKEVAKVRVKKWQNRDPEKQKERMARYRKSHPEKLWFGAIKQRAKEKGLEFSISYEDLEIPEFCPILGIPLFRAGKKHTDNSPSLDRIDSKKGYVKGNIQVISHKDNILKNNADLWELIMLGEWAKEQLLENDNG